MTRTELKSLAREQIKGNIGMLFLISLVIALITGAVEAVGLCVPFASLAASIVVTPGFVLSNILIYLNLTKGRKPMYEDAFAGFKDFWTAFKATFLTGFFTFLWMLLFVIPGYVKAISYSQTMYVVAENPGMSALDAIEESKRIMRGHKMEYFVLLLSFIGWIFLGLLTFGILYIWIIPYVSATQANFYNSIKPRPPVPPVIEGEAAEADAPAEA